MTATPARLKPVRPGQVQNALFNALARHGIEPATAESIWLDLTTGQDPRPNELPAQFLYRGIQIVWPAGRHTRPLRPDELRSLNAALRAANPPKTITYKDGTQARSHGVRRRDSLLDPEDSAEIGRHAYAFLWKSFNSDDYNPEPVRAAAMRALVEEATAVRHAEPVPVQARCVCGQEVLAAEGALAPTHWCEPAPEHALDNAPCWSKSPGGKPCLLDNHHIGKHKNGRTHWMDPATRATVQHVTPAEQRLADPVDPLSKLQADLAALSLSG